ncbi:hypothetical protein ACV1EC_06055 [Aeromonas hydrophila]
MMNPNLEFVMLNGRQLHEIIDIHTLGPLGPQYLRRAIGGGANLLGSLRGQRIRLEVSTDSDAEHWLYSLSRQPKQSLDLEWTSIGAKQNRIGKRGHILEQNNGIWIFEFPDWETGQ